MMRRTKVSPAEWAFLNDEHELADRLNVFEVIALQCRGTAGLWNEYREEILGEWVAKRPGTRPSLWWEHDAPEPRKERESQRAYLKRHKLLQPSELRKLRTRRVA
jgi:hypothetical protein